MGWWKYEHFTLSEVFSNELTPDIDFTDETVVQCDVPVAEILLQIMVTYR